jgi:hypothetical protein
MNSPVTSATGLGTYRRTIVACFVFRREISRKAVWDFFDSIGQKLKISMGAYVFRSAPNNGHRATTAACLKAAKTGSEVSFDHQGSVLAIGLVLVAASETRVVAEPLIAVEPAHVMRVSAMALRTSPCLKSAARADLWN